MSRIGLTPRDSLKFWRILGGNFNPAVVDEELFSVETMPSDEAYDLYNADFPDHFYACGRFPDRPSQMSDECESACSRTDDRKIGVEWYYGVPAYAREEGLANKSEEDFVFDMFGWDMTIVKHKPSNTVLCMMLSKDEQEGGIRLYSTYTEDSDPSIVAIDTKTYSIVYGAIRYDRFPQDRYALKNYPRIAKAETKDLNQTFFKFGTVDFEAFIPKACGEEFDRFVPFMS